jgi:hypothetical protein
MRHRYPVVPMGPLFDQCRLILDEEVRPIHYARLTEMALQRLGVPVARVHWQKQVEDVREKCCQSGQHGIVYIGQPLCVAVLREWLDDPSGQLTLMPVTQHEVGVTVRAVLDAGLEALMRNRYMVQKTNARPERVAEARFRGLLVEQNIAQWFARRFPEFYEPPPNQNDWTQPSPVDFYLNIPGHGRVAVDVCGQKLNGKYANPGNGKSAVDLHLLVQLDEKRSAVLWTGVMRGRDFLPGTLRLERAKTPQRLVFWLNCLQRKHPYKTIVELGQQVAAKTPDRPVRWKSAVGHDVRVTVPAGTIVRFGRVS